MRTYMHLSVWMCLDHNFYIYGMDFKIIVLPNPLLHRYSFSLINNRQLFENIVGKEEIARNEQFLLFPQCFLLNQLYPHLLMFMTSYLYLLLNWKSPGLACDVKD